MRYPYLIALAIFMAMPTVSTRAVEPTADQRLKAAGDSSRRPRKKCPPKPSGVFSETGLIQFRLLSGRIEIDPMRYRKGSQEHVQDGYKESITVTASGGIPSVYYSYQDDYQRLQLVAQHGKSLRLESTLNATGEQAILIQYPSESIRWTTLRDPSVNSDLDREVSGQTLLHIIGQDKAGFQIHVDALITRMLRGRSLIELTRRTEAYLQQNSAELSVVTRKEVDELVNQLAASKSSERRAAMTQLKKHGTSVIAFLKTALDRNDLDTEQVARIRSVIARCPRMDEDTPSSLACLLSTDREHWQILADNMSQAQWIAANEHVRRCGLDSLRR